MYVTRGVGGIDTYLALVRGQPVNREQLAAHAARPWGGEFSSMWFGLGGRALLEHLAFGQLSEHSWRELERATRATWFEDFYIGAAGVSPVLAVAGSKNPLRARPIAALVHRRAVKYLTRAIRQHAEGGSPLVGFGHGVAGVLVAFEQCCALLGVDGSPTRAPAIELLSSTSILVDGVPLWPVKSRDPKPSEVLGFCHGATGVCLASMLGYRYSTDPLYEPLINETLKTLGLRGGLPGFCCGTLGRVEALIEAHRLTGDEGVLTTAKALFAGVSLDSFGGDETWLQGVAGYRFTQARLETPALDLPGFPPEIERLP